MKRGCFLAGEATVTLPLCMTRAARWDHFTTPQPVIAGSPGTIIRRAVSYDAVICYFSLDDDELRASIQRALIDSRVACWPDAGWLPSISDRRELILRAKSAGLFDHPLDVVTDASELSDACSRVGFPAVLKLANQQSGLGKHRIDDPSAVAAGVRAMQGASFASVEPFFSGTSFRIFVSGERNRERTVCVRYDNPHDWVKNAAGCEVVSDSAPPDVIDHAIRAHRIFQYDATAEIPCGTLLSGIDYVREDVSGKWRFLEWNGFPWLGGHPEIERLGRSTIQAAMSRLESQV